MKGASLIITIGTAFLFVSCSESGRDNDLRNEAAVKANADKFDGKTGRDATFVFEMVRANFGEIKLAELANQKSRSTEVKEIAQSLQADHMASLMALKTIAQSKAISVAVEESASAKRKLGNLAGKSVKDFDEEWCEEMIARHERDINAYEERLEDTEDMQVRHFISQNLPVLKRHHAVLTACCERIKNKAG